MKKFNSFKTLFERHIFQFDKINYFLRRKDNITSCALCDLLKDKNDSLLICSSDYISVCVNLYPYNSGHIMLFPIRHVEDYLDLKDEENQHLFLLTKFFIEALKELYKPSGYNIGMNLGENSGASIRHVHQHIVPRFYNELGMIDIIGGSKVIVESVDITKKRLAEYTLKNSHKLPFKMYI